MHKQVHEYLAEPMHPPLNLDSVGQKIIQSVLAISDAQSLLSKIAFDLGNAFGAEACWVIADLKAGIVAQTGTWYQEKTPVVSPQAITQLLSHSIIKAIAAGAEPLTESFREILPFSSFAVLPVRSSLGGNGLIVLGRFQEGEWGNTLKEKFTMVTNSVAIALERVQLQQQTQTCTQYKTLLKDLNWAVRHTSNLESVYDFVVSRTGQSLGASHGWIVMLTYQDPLYYMRKENTTEIEAKVVCHWSAETGNTEVYPEISHPTYSFNLAHFPLAQEAWQNAPQPLAIPNMAAIAQGKVKAPSLFNLSEMPGLLVVPLMGGTGVDVAHSVVLGLLIFQNRIPRFWDEEELELINSVSAQTSTAIHHHRTVRRVLAVVDERTAQLQSSLEVQARLYDTTRQLYETTRQQAARLEHLNKLKDEFLSTIQHELNTPLTSMRLAIENLRRFGQSPERQARYLDILEQQWNREKNLIQDLLKLRELEDLEAHPESVLLQPFEFNFLATELAQNFEQQWQYKKLNLVIDYARNSSGNAISIQTHSDSLKRILQELLNNAGKFSHTNTTVYLRVVHEGENVVITVTNTGLAIPPNEQEQIFQPFHRGEGVTNQAIPGIGLGLALVEGLTKHLQGKIEVSSRGDRSHNSSEITFKLTLPQI